MPARILIVDDEPAVRFTLRSVLEEDGIDVVEAVDGRSALLRVGQGGIDLVITDQKMPGLEGLALLDELAKLSERPPTILLTAHGSERLAVQAMRRGAVDYLAKPFDPDEVRLVAARALESVRLRLENQRLRGERALGRFMVFRSNAIREVGAMIDRLASRETTVLITGETGTGKELVARAIVDGSRRSGAPYVRFNCAALPRELAEAELFGHARGAFTGADHERCGLFQEADGGTLLLDEIAELDLTVQGKLLRVLQDGEVRPLGGGKAQRVDVRVLASTHRHLPSEVEAGRFREDLYYRLNVVPIHLAPLRERREDIAPLVEHFLRRFSDRFGIHDLKLSARLAADLESRPWRGNVRELENTMERLVALSAGPVLDDPSAPDNAAVSSALALKQRVDAFERGLIAAELTRNGGNQSETARRLGISRATLISKLKKHELLP